MGMYLGCFLPGGKAAHNNINSTNQQSYIQRKHTQKKGRGWVLCRPSIWYSRSVVFVRIPNTKYHFFKYSHYSHIIFRKTPPFTTIVNFRAFLFGICNIRTIRAIRSTLLIVQKVVFTPANSMSKLYGWSCAKTLVHY